jgi:hypothetical protein
LALLLSLFLKYRQRFSGRNLKKIPKGVYVTELKTLCKEKGNGTIRLRLSPLLDRIYSVDPAQTIYDSRSSLKRNLGRIQAVNEAQIGSGHPAAAFIRDVRHQSEVELARSYRELLIVLADKPDDDLALRAMDLIAESGIYTADISGVRCLAKLLGSASPIIAGTDSKNLGYSVSVSDARTFLEIRINKFERALAAKEGLEGELLSFVEEGLSKAVDDIRSSFREIVMVLASRPSDELGIKALEIIASRSFTIKDKIAIQALIALMEPSNETNPLSQEASSASLSVQGP